MVEGTLKGVEFERQATVVTYKVPPTYGGQIKEFNGDRGVDLSRAYRLSEDHCGKMRIYPGALELRNGRTYALTSRTVCAVGIADSIYDARKISLKGVEAVEGGSLWNRRDIASKKHIEKSVMHLKMLRS